MITYKYSFVEDFRWSYRTIKNLKWLKSKKLIIFYPNVFRMIFLWIKKPKTDFQVDMNITCYWIHAGTWGAYTPPDKIFICPWEIDKTGGLERVIKHEVTHLKLSDKTESLTHDEKEAYVNRHSSI
ncbi:hypothetical protein COT97_04015 [Candidatus Falkowbacteria bacterium CG10_big_fil_rev_8_21_14_0_10_39_11]|uniref:Uncharacterized protein n=1 Tax=Candidatus Falkowbacteria bacterium CG10_big_fil_rev_8_21_14_0_10_39_11 TaxID=1974565 RepID=A0A2H0V495_9BACT|nr:MAG: hypothetical protein COT97_04015 [Candidatus Falkowbacteria bacterium CG10_big_fil_rev_8_21_14_0_10_39_11]